MKILYVLPALCIGGMERFVQRLSLEMFNRGHQVSVVCTVEKGALAHDVEASGVPVHLCRLEGKRELLFSPTLYAHIQAMKPDIVHSQSGVWLPAAVASWRAGVSLVHTEHGLPVGGEPWRAMVTKWLAARLTSAAIAVSAPLHQHLERIMPTRSIVTIVNGVAIGADLQNSRSKARQTLRIDESVIAFVVVARLEYIKGVDILIEALAMVSDAVRNVEIIVVGDGPERARLERLSGSLTHARMRFLGSRSDVVTLLPAFDGLLLTSRSEGMPLAVLEAMAHGVPVLATPVGDLPTVLDYGFAGMLAAGTSPQDVASAFEMFASRADIRASLRDRGLDRVTALYSFDTMSDRYEELYQTVVPW